MPGIPPASLAPAATPSSGALRGAAALRSLDKGPLESCLCVVVLALSVVMAGTGEWLRRVVTTGAGEWSWLTRVSGYGRHG